MEGPSTSSFSFVVTGAGALKGKFVSCDGGHGEKFVGVVREILRGNRYFEHAESVSEYERAGSAGIGFAEGFPAGEWDYSVANCALLGVFDGKGFGKALEPPKPGAKVFEAEGALLERFLRFDSKGLFLGKLSGHEVDVRVNLSSLLQKHLAILAMSGSGKSVLATVILEELLSRKKEDGRIAAIVFDVHGEYAGFARDAEFSKKTKLFESEAVKISCRHLTSGFFRRLVPEATAIGSREFQKILDGLKSGEDAFDLDDVYDAVNASEIGEKVKPPLLSAIYELKRLGLFGKVDYPSPREIAVQGGLCVFDFSDTISQKRRQAIVAYFGEKLFELRRRNDVPPYLMLVEEAHNFAAEGSGKDEAIAKRVIETIAREGRKFGASLCLVSQRPKRLSTTALSQCNTLIIMRMTNPYDLKHVGESCEAVDAESAGQISSLSVGEGIVIGEAAPVPFFAKFRNKKMQASGKSVALEELGKKFEEAHAHKAASKEDAQAFV